MEISNRRSMANTYFISGNIKKAFNTLMSIKQSVIQSFSDEERKALKNIEENFNKISPALSHSLSSSFNKGSKELYSNAFNTANIFYSNYNDKLMDLLDKYGYLIGEQTDASRMKF